ncbi:MAG: hypothetical protein DHS20C15_13530 [Planctomycetota bacterium]|nr:MAG: hypothetical protein DHS20C15_13530 [Planctomycetota bacterium]
MPFVDKVWWSELPVFALPQLPKLLLVDWWRDLIITQVLIPMGSAGGAYSPNMDVARPYALGLSYLVLLAPVIVIACWKRRATQGAAPWVWALCAALALDSFVTLQFRSQPGLTLF